MNKALEELAMKIDLAWLKEMSREELEKIIIRLSEDCSRLRNELDEAKGVVR